MYKELNEELIEKENKKIKILIADDNPQVKLTISNYIKDQEDIEVIGQASDGHETMKMVRELSPDILILDVILPYLDGIEVLEQINTLQNKPKCIMLSAVGQEQIIQRSMKLGAEYYIVKPFEIDLLVKRIRELKENKNKINTELISYSKREILSQINSRSKSVENLVCEVVHEIGIPVHVKGYKFVREAIHIVLKDSSSLEQITKVLYPKIARKFRTTTPRVERAIRHSIEMAWEKGNAEFKEEIFGNTIYENKKKPTNSEFIAMIVDKIKLELGIF